jgi:SAM-dependent methyltransferase
MAVGRLLSGWLSSERVVCAHAWQRHANERDCTCDFVRCLRCAVVKKFARCPFHESHAQDHRAGREYFGSELMGMFDDGIPQNTSYATELSDALAEIGAPPLAPGSSVLEVGAGIGRLVPWFLRSGMRYTAVEPEPWAGRYIRDAYGVPVIAQAWHEMTVEPQSIDVVASIHTLEHLADADAAIAKMASAARRHVLLVVPEGWDKWNPDHWWMFTTDVLRTWARNLGLRIYGPVQKRVAEPEDTIYALFERNAA